MTEITRLDGSSVPEPMRENFEREAEAPSARASSSHGAGCPRCGCCDSRVLYTRPAFGRKTVRRRECRYCGKRFSTYETVVGG